MRTLAILLLTVLPAAHAELLAGAAARSIVPPFPTFMGGFGDRMQFFEGVHDDVLARALVLDNGDTQLVVIGSDLMALDDAHARGVRERVEKETGIPGANVMVSCVHNHSAPSYYQHKDPAEQAKVREFFVEQYSDAAIEAFQKREPAEIGWAIGELRGATRNRQQDNDTAIDPQLMVIRVEKLEGREIIATLFNFTGHPVIQGSRNLLLSGEFPGAACRTIQKVLGGVAIFTQGACGDITVNRQGDPWLEIERVGNVVAGEVIRTAESIVPQGAARLAAMLEEFPLAPKELPAPEAARAELDKLNASIEEAKNTGLGQPVVRSLERRAELSEALAKQAEGLADGSLTRPESFPGSAQVMQIGDIVLVAVPGELFVEYALEMRQRTEYLIGKHMALVGYANGYVGYLVTPRARYTGGYEASVARVTWDAGRILAERAMNLVQRVVR